eukprot:1190392-Prorocentrum_minimum.AAC.4
MRPPPPGAKPGTPVMGGFSYTVILLASGQLIDMLLPGYILPSLHRLVPAPQVVAHCLEGGGGMQLEREESDMEKRFQEMVHMEA